MKSSNRIFFCIISLIMGLSSCVRDELNDQEGTALPTEAILIEDLEVPGTFMFQTSRVFHLTMSDLSSSAKYNVYSYEDNQPNNTGELLYSGFAIDGQLDVELTISQYIDRLVLEKVTTTSAEYAELSVLESPSNLKAKASQNRTLNETPVCPIGPDNDGDGVCDTIDKDDDNDGILDSQELERGAALLVNPDFESFNPSAAVVQSGNPPAYFFDMSQIPGWNTTATDGLIEVWASGHLGVTSQSGNAHIEMNATQNATLFQDFATIPGSQVRWSIWHRGRSGTDVANVFVGSTTSLGFVEVMSTDSSAWVEYTGVYEVPLGQTTTRLAFQSVAGSSSGNLLDNMNVTIIIPLDTDGDGISDHLDNDSDNDGCPDVREAGHTDLNSDGILDGSGVLMDGTVAAADGYTGNHPNVLNNTINTACTDQDGDGIIDSLDDYPNDPSRASTTYYPSDNTFASLAYEDLWPFMGDYDFNDLTIAYRVVGIQNATNQIIAVEYQIDEIRTGGSFSNGFALRLEGLSPNAIASVSGQLLNEGYFNLSANGTEIGQTDAVIPFFDDSLALDRQSLSITIELSVPVASLRTLVPYDPFMVINGNREMEVHLTGKTPTTLGNNTPVVTGNNADVDGNYQNENNLPWAINIAGDYSPPLEKVSVNEAYMFFNAWAISGGTVKPDWFLDLEDHRIPTLIQQ